MPRGFNIVLHIADKQRLFGHQLVFLQDFVNFFALVPNADVGLVQVLVEPGNGSLHREMVLVYCAQQKSPQFAGAAKFEEIAGMRQFAN